MSGGFLPYNQKVFQVKNIKFLDKEERLKSNKSNSQKQVDSHFLFDQENVKSNKMEQTVEPHGFLNNESLDPNKVKDMILQLQPAD